MQQAGWRREAEERQPGRPAALESPAREGHDWVQRRQSLGVWVAAAASGTRKGGSQTWTRLVGRQGRMECSGWRWVWGSVQAPVGRSSSNNTADGWVRRQGHQEEGRLVHPGGCELQGCRTALGTPADTTPRTVINLCRNPIWTKCGVLGTQLRLRVVFTR